MKPLVGDKWTRKLEVISVKGRTVTIRQGTKEFDMTVDEYDLLSSACVIAGDVLTRAEVDDDDDCFQ